MVLRFICLFVSLFLLGCTTANISTKDDLNVIVEVRSPEYIRAKGREYGYDHALGLAFITSPTQKCKIMVPKLTTRTFYIWEHELRHCREGRFHPLEKGRGFTPLPVL